MRVLGGRWRRLGCLATRSVAHRWAATVAAHEIAPPQPVLHATIADAHIHASGLLADLLERQPPTSLKTYVDLLAGWWRVVGQLVLLPRASEEIADLPQFLAECVRTANRSESGGKHGGGGGGSSSASDEAALLDQWDEWVWSSDPRAMPTAAAFEDAVEEPAMASTDTAVSRREVVSFPELTSLLHSYGRYHRGVRWGASKSSEDGKNVGGAAAAAYHRRRYLLHPWHGVCCPEGTAQQMPYVHVLRWMLAGTAEGEGQAPATELWSRHRAIESFQLPQEAASSFRALDVCSQSGYVTDLLLRAGAGLVVAADADVHALGNTESTYHEHLREGRSKRRNQVLLTRRCDELPMPLKSEGEKGSSSSNSNSATAEQKPAGDNVAATNVSAAEQRRRRARQQGRGYSGLRGGASGADLDVTPASLPDGSPFHVVYFHPPAPSAVWPVVAADGAATASSSLHRTAWWQSLVRRAARTGLPPRLLLPFVPCSAAAGRGSNPLTTLSGLRRAVEALRTDVTERSSSSSLYDSHGDKSADASTTTSTGGGDALLREDGYVVLVLPRTYDVGDLLQATGEESMEKAPSLADWVVAQLDGYYDIVLRRRCRLHEAPSKAPSAAATLDAVEEALVTYPSRLVAAEDSDATHTTKQVRSDGRRSTAADVFAGSSVKGDATHTPQWREQLSRFYEKEWWQDVIVLRKNPVMVQRCAAARHGEKAQLFLQQQQQQQRRLAQLRRRSQQENAVAWEDSFEYNEYHPRDGSALVSHHWTDLMPTYSYLESDFYDGGAGQRNFLAVGHAPASVHTPPATAAGYAVPSGESGVTAGHTEMTAAASAKAAMNFHTLFAQELRTRRRSKLRKLALSPLERQEWYIDEKLVKASGARVDLMNELSKWDFKDYDN